MSAVQDHTPVVRELSERHPGQPEPQPSVAPRGPGLDSPREVTPDGPREHSPPRFSQLLEPLPEGSEPHPPRPRTGTSAGTNSVTLVNQPGTIGTPNNDLTAQSVFFAQDRTQLQPTLDRRPPMTYDPIRGDNGIQTQFSDDEHGRGSLRRGSVPRPRPVFNPTQDGAGNGSRVGLRAPSSGDLYSHPQQPQEPPQKTVKDRIEPTLEAAKRERDKYKRKARTQGILINGAIGLQVIVGAITTGVAAGSKNIGSAVAVLGGISTALASYLAKARGSGEPEFSHLRSRELSTFIREVEAFVMDKGHRYTSEFDVQITIYRERFELIIKTEGENSTSGTGYASPGHHAPGVHPVPNQQQMMAMHSGGGQYQYQTMPPQAYPGGGQLNEKQMWKNEKAISAVA